MNEISGQETSNIYEVDLSAYRAAIAKCEMCVCQLECRGPTPVEPNCPNKREFIPLPEVFK